MIDIPTTCKAEGEEIITMENISKMKFKDYRTEMVEGKCTMKDIIFIHKEAGTKKDAVRVKRIQDIPDFLKDAIKVVDGKIQLECVEGTETAEFGAVIGYEVCDEKGEDLGWLSELDNIWRTGEVTYIRNPKGKRVYVTREGAKIDN